MDTPLEVVFVDCDDCIYYNDWATAKKITNAIAAYTEKIGVSKEEAYQLYKTHGTCLKGLLLQGKVDEPGTEEYLFHAHDIDYSDITPDSAMRSILEILTKRFDCWIFTASSSDHAKRCMERVGVGDLNWKGIIDTRTCKFETKHSDASFKAAMEAAGVTNPAGCMLLDDSRKNIEAAKRFGWRTVLVGKKDRDSGAPIACNAADVHLETLHTMPDILPELFDDSLEMKVSNGKNNGFYISAAKRFLQGGVSDDGEKRKLEPVRVLVITGVGAAIAAAAAAAAVVEAENLATIQKVETSSIDIGHGGGANYSRERIRIVLRRV